jgi:hypothetical protein
VVDSIKVGVSADAALHLASVKFAAGFMAKYVEHNFSKLIARVDEPADSIDTLATAMLARCCAMCQAEIATSRDADVRRAFRDSGVQCAVIVWFRASVWVSVLGDVSVFVLEADGERISRLQVTDDDSEQEKQRLSEVGAWYEQDEGTRAIRVFGSVPTTRGIGYTFQVKMLEWLQPEWRKVGQARSAAESLSVMRDYMLQWPVLPQPDVFRMDAATFRSVLIVSKPTLGLLNQSAARRVFDAVGRLKKDDIDGLQLELGRFGFAGISSLPPLRQELDRSEPDDDSDRQPIPNPLP